MLWVALLVALAACEARLSGAPGRDTGADAGPRDGPAPAARDGASLRDGARAGDAHPADGSADASAADGPQADAARPTCALVPSGPVQAQADGEVIENLRITATSGAGITVSGRRNVTIRNVHVLHAGGHGIALRNADDVRIEGVAIEHTGAPPAGANSSAARNSIDCLGSARPRIERVRLLRGSSGIYLLQCPQSQLRFVAGHDFRGPFPRGQLVQWDKSPGGLLEDFSVIQPPGSWPEDNVNVYQSQGVTVRRGLIDGNNSPSGVGVIFDGGDATGLVEDVDAIRMGNGCFSAYAGGAGTIFRRTRCRENICSDQGRGPPLSNALMWAGKPGLSDLRIEDSSYFASCNGNLVWPRDSFAVIELAEVDFALRAPVVNALCWE